MKYFDLQVNGGFGVDFSAPGLAEPDFLRTAEKILSAGVTRFLPTIITSRTEMYRERLPMLAKAVDHAGLNYEIPGFHLEGPFISGQPGAVGAHNPEWVTAPAPEKLRELHELASGRIAMLTLAAEYPGTPETVQEAHRLGIAISLGHQLANSGQIRAVGADALTHLGNGIPNTIDRHRNPIWSGLAEDSLTAMIITDGHHLPPEVIKCIIRIKGADRVIVTSDASSVAGLPPGRYTALGNDAILEPDGRLHNPVKRCLVGSAMLMPRCMDFLRSLNLLNETELEKVSWLNPHSLLKLNPQNKFSPSVL